MGLVLELEMEMELERKGKLEMLPGPPTLEVWRGLEFKLEDRPSELEVC